MFSGRAAILVLVLCLLPRMAHAQQQVTNALSGGNGDVCSTFPHSSIPLTFSAATSLTQQIALASGKAIYVCGLTFITASASGIQLEYGTGSNCGTGTTVLSGAYIASTAVSTPTNATIMVTPVGQALCAVTTGGTGQANGWLSYVQM